MNTSDCGSCSIGDLILSGLTWVVDLRDPPMALVVRPCLGQVDGLGASVPTL